MADVVIRGIEMPNAEGCEVIIRIQPNGEVLDAHKIHIGATAIPLPEGHGDLVDRDAFRAENGLNAKCEHCPRNTYKCQNDMIHTKMEFCEMLDDAPVIVPAEGRTEECSEN